MNNTSSQQWNMAASIWHLKVFESVGQLRGVRRASEECHLSQPAVTQAVAKLEERMGVSLFERRVSGSYLNEFGVILHRRTRRFFSQIEEALGELGVPRSPLSIPAWPAALRGRRCTVSSPLRGMDRLQRQPMPWASLIALCNALVEISSTL